jgi:hypothetical protein
MSDETSTPERVVTHENPVWRERSTSVIRGAIPDPPDSERWYEQLWARQIDELKYELCCIPFATYDFALGDIVEVGSSGDSKYTIHRVLERSGRHVLRVWLAGAQRATWDELQGLLRFRHLLLEFRKPALVAIDAPDGAAAEDLAAELTKMRRAGKLTYEKGSEGYHPRA